MHFNNFRDWYINEMSMYLHTVDVNPTHAATAVNEEDELAMHLP